MKRRKDAGFTLIELMIVIAVIGILAVVLVPKVGAVKTQAKTTGVETNMKVVEGYVHSRITKWDDDSTTFTQEKIAADIAASLSSSTEKITNPFSKGENIFDLVNAASDTSTVNDAVQIIESGTPATNVGKGAVIVSIPADTSTGIVITGTNLNGSEYSSVTIKP